MAFNKRPPKKDFVKENIKVLREAPVDKNGTELAVVRWISDGTAHAPQLVNQEVYTDRLTRQRKYGKVKGLKWIDYMFLTETPERIQEIRDLLRDAYGKRAPAKSAGQDAAANDYEQDSRANHATDDEEIPF